MNLHVTVSGTGSAELKAKRWISAAVDGLRFGVSEGAFMMEQGMIQRVPVDTGHLRDSIHTTTIADDGAKQVKAVSPVVEAANPWGIDPAYARRIEYGFVGPDSLGRVYHQPPQSYIRSTYDELKDEVSKTIKDSVIETLAGVRV